MRRKACIHVNGKSLGGLVGRGRTLIVAVSYGDSCVLAGARLSSTALTDTEAGGGHRFTATMGFLWRASAASPAGQKHRVCLLLEVDELWGVFGAPSCVCV